MDLVLDVTRACVCAFVCLYTMFLLFTVPPLAKPDGVHQSETPLTYSPVSIFKPKQGDLNSQTEPIITIRLTYDLNRVKQVGECRHIFASFQIKVVCSINLTLLAFAFSL